MCIYIYVHVSRHAIYNKYSMYILCQITTIKTTRLIGQPKSCPFPRIEVEALDQSPELSYGSYGHGNHEFFREIYGKSMVNLWLINGKSMVNDD